ncbi:MAG: hypothetical protein V1775_03820 [Bacteroidota bacterium]
MKKWSFLFAALLIGVAITMSSCGDDGEEIDPGPSLNLKGGSGYTADDVTIEIGTAIKIGVLGGKSSVSGNKLTKFELIFTSNNVPMTWKEATLNADSYDWDTTFTLESFGTGRLSFELTDKGGMTTKKSFEITVQGPETKKWSNVELGSWNDAIGSFFSSSEGFSYTVTQTFNTPANQSKIDFLFFKGNTFQNTIASPSDSAALTINDLKLSSWTNRNATFFNPTTITAAQFDAIGANYQFPVFDLGQVSTRMTLLEANDVFLFKTATNKVGLVKVISTYTKGDKMKIDVVMEK